MIHITIDGQQFEIGPDSMQVENEEVFEMVKNSSRVFNSCSVNNLSPYVLVILSYDGSIKNFAFYLKDNAQWHTVSFNYVLYRRNIYTLKHSKFQTEFEIPLSYSSDLVEIIYSDNWCILDVAIVKGSYLSRPNITVYAKMICNEQSYNSAESPPPDRWYELCTECTVYIIPYCRLQMYEGLYDELTKLFAPPI